MGEFLLSVCFILVLGKNIHLICFVPPVLICGMHLNICGESFRLFYIMLLRLDVSCCNLRSDLSTFWILLFVFSVPPTVILVPLTLWGLLIFNNTWIFRNFSGVVFDRVHTILQLVISLITSDCFFIDGLCPGMVNPVAFWIFVLEVM